MLVYQRVWSLKRSLAPGTTAGQGLPSDRVSCENGAILCNSQRWSVLGDVNGELSEGLHQ